MNESELYYNFMSDGLISKEENFANYEVIQDSMLEYLTNERNISPELALTYTHNVTDLINN